jgi:hypothetical protein
VPSPAVRSKLRIQGVLAALMVVAVFGVYGTVFYIRYFV